MTKNPIDTPGYPPEAFDQAFNETMRTAPAIDMMAVRDRALSVAVELKPDSIQTLFEFADLIQSYIMNGANPFVATETTN